MVPLNNIARHYIYARLEIIDRERFSGYVIHELQKVSPRKIIWLNMEFLRTALLRELFWQPVALIRSKSETNQKPSLRR